MYGIHHMVTTLGYHGTERREHNTALEATAKAIGRQGLDSELVLR